MSQNSRVGTEDGLSVGPTSTAKMECKVNKIEDLNDLKIQISVESNEETKKHQLGSKPFKPKHQVNLSQRASQQGQMTFKSSCKPSMFIDKTDISYANSTTNGGKGRIANHQMLNRDLVSNGP